MSRSNEKNPVNVARKSNTLAKSKKLTLYYLTLAIMFIAFAITALQA